MCPPGCRELLGKGRKRISHFSVGTRDPFTSCPDCIEVEVFTIANADMPDADLTEYHARPGVKEAGNPEPFGSKPFSRNALSI